MMLTPCADESAAAWILSADLPWQQRAAFGPSRFPAYARLRFIPDPRYYGQSAVDIGADGSSDAEQLQAAVRILRSHTRTPNDLYFGFWDGSWGTNFSGTKVDIPNRSYYLFRGDVSDLSEWDTSGADHAPDREEPIPAFIWPADHAWCVANDVDPHWAGIGGASKLFSNSSLTRDWTSYRLFRARISPATGSYIGAVIHGARRLFALC